MCGIAGFFIYDSLSDTERRLIKSVLFGLQSRGRDGFGVYAVLQDEEYLVKGNNPVAHFETHIDDLISRLHPGDVLIANSRAHPLPEGISERNNNLQPFSTRSWILAHNGTISNDEELQIKYGIEPCQVDTQVVCELFEKIGWEETISQLVGGYAFIAWNRVEKKFLVLKNFKTLWEAYTPNLYCVCSEPEQLFEFGNRVWDDLKVARFPQYSGISICYPSKPVSFGLKNSYWSSTTDLDPNKAIVVTSGGIDSITSAYIAQKLHKKDILLLNFDYGQRARHQEKQAALHYATVLDCPFKGVDISWLGAMGKSPLTDKDIELPLGKRSVESTLAWVPARNMTMLSIAASIAEAEGIKWIYYGGNLEESGTGYNDNDVEFMYLYNQLLDYGVLRPGMRIVNALGRLMKPEILELGFHLGCDFSKTWSCDEGFEKPDGICGCCLTRQKTFQMVGRKDTQEYLEVPADRYVWESDALWTPKKIDITEVLKYIQEPL